LAEEQQQDDQTDQQQDGQVQDDKPTELTERPDWLPENLWDEAAKKPIDFSTLRQPAADLPSDPAAYELPTVEGVDLTQTADSPFFHTLRKSAFDAGIGQEGFQKIVTDWTEAEKAAADTYFEEQQKALGANAEPRLAALSTWLDGSLPKTEAEALRSISTNATVFQALERLMNKGGVTAPRDEAVPTKTGKTREEIKALMASKEYSGKPHERNPAVIKEVDDWFATNAAEKK